MGKSVKGPSADWTVHEDGRMATSPLEAHCLSREIICITLTVRDSDKTMGALVIRGPLDAEVADTMNGAFTLALGRDVTGIFAIGEG